MQEQNLLRNAVAFYRLLAAWLLRLAYPAVAQNNMPLVPLPEPAPIEFRSLPVHFCLNPWLTSHVALPVHRFVSDVFITLLEAI